MCKGKISFLACISKEARICGRYFRFQISNLHVIWKIIVDPFLKVVIFFSSITGSYYTRINFLHHGMLSMLFIPFINDLKGVWRNKSNTALLKRKFTIIMSTFVMSERLDPLTCRCLEAITLFLSTCHPWYSIQAEWYFKRFLFTRFTGSLHAPLRPDTTTLTLFTTFWSVLDRRTCESQANILWKLLRLASSVVILWKRAHYF